MHFEEEKANMEKIRLCQEIVDEIQTESGRSVCHLQFSQETFDITDSHLGGVPYLPHDGKYPMGDDGQMLWLCAQINFAQMPSMEDFPKKGILQFFLSDFDYDGGFGLYSEEDWTVQSQWKVCWYPEVDNTVTESECIAKMPDPWNTEERLWRVPDEPLKMTFQPIGQEGVNYEDFRFGILFAEALKKRLPEEDPERYMPYEIYDETPENREHPNRKALEQIIERMKCGGCKMGGYPRYEQDDPRLYGEELPAWDTLLFQLDGDTFTYPCGDIGEKAFISLNGGTLNFLIRSEDLMKQDFSNVLAQWACS
ncbi:MAG: DUF1963 domain-containing protein [Lachnospiraceae bacterium]|nr:DUF1963 domain-containing protein [Lachnospiraceae bacterium]